MRTAVFLLFLLAVEAVASGVLLVIRVVLTRRSAIEDEMKDANKKNKWVIRLGQPDLSHPDWKDRKPTPRELVEIWVGQSVSRDGLVLGLPDTYPSKEEATKKMVVLQRQPDAYFMKVEKFNPRKKHP